LRNKTPQGQKGISSINFEARVTDFHQLHFFANLVLITGSALNEVAFQFGKLKESLQERKKRQRPPMITNREAGSGFRWEFLSAWWCFYIIQHLK
jgi:hypothetical protein